MVLVGADCDRGAFAHLGIYPQILKNKIEVLILF